MTKLFSITSLATLPFQKVYAKCHVVDVIISLMGGVHCNIYCSKLTVQKLGFFGDSIATNDELALLTIEGKVA